MKNYLIIIGSLLLFGCHSNYTYREGFEKAWNPDLGAEKQVKKKSIEHSNLVESQVSKSLKESNWHRDTSIKLDHRPFTALEEKLTILTVKTAELIPNKINRFSSKKTETKIPGFLTHKCRSLGMTIGYRLIIYGFLLSAIFIGIIALTEIDGFGGYAFWIFNVIITLLAFLSIFLGFLIWLFSLIITSLTQ